MATMHKWSVKFNTRWVKAKHSDVSVYRESECKELERGEKEIGRELEHEGKSFSRISKQEKE